MLRVSVLLLGLTGSQYAAAQIAALDYPHSHCMPGAVCACIDPSSTPPEDKRPCGLDDHVPNMGTPHGVTQAAELAQLANAVYSTDGTGPPVGWRQVYDQRYDSGFHATVYQNDFGNTVLSYEGTVPSDLGDLKANADSALLFPEQYQQAIRLAQLMHLRYGSGLTITGHSLGGGLAQAAGVATGAPTVTFNPANLSTTTQYAVGAGGSHDNILNIVQKNDWLANVLNQATEFYFETGGLGKKFVIDFQLEASPFDPALMGLAKVQGHSIRGIADFLMSESSVPLCPHAQAGLSGDGTQSVDDQSSPREASCRECYFPAYEFMGQIHVVFREIHGAYLETRVYTQGELEKLKSTISPLTANPAMATQMQIMRSWMDFLVTYNDKYKEGLNAVEEVIKTIANCEQRYFNEERWYAVYGLPFKKRIARKYQALPLGP